MRKILLTTTFSVLFLLSAQKALASEGDFDLKNRIGTSATCSGWGQFMQDLKYHLLISCRNITYPGGVEVVNYVLWATPLSGGNAVRIGELGLGKGQFTTKEAYSTLFVTIERDKGVRTPTGQVVMQGPITARPNLVSNATPEPAGQQPNPTEGAPTATPIATARPQSGIARFVTGGIVAFIALFAVIFVLFIITRR